MNAPRDVPAPDLQIALRIVDASDDAPEKKGDIVIVSDDDVPDASDVRVTQDATVGSDVGTSR